MKYKSVNEMIWKLSGWRFKIRWFLGRHYKPSSLISRLPGLSEIQNIVDKHEGNRKEIAKAIYERLKDS
jgi:hypothetical protein